MAGYVEKWIEYMGNWEMFGDCWADVAEILTILLNQCKLQKFQQKVLTNVPPYHSWKSDAVSPRGQIWGLFFEYEIWISYSRPLELKIYPFC